MTKTRSLTIIIVVGFLVSILFSSMFSFAEEKISLTSYFPAPNAFYYRLNSTFLSISDTAHVGKQLNIGSATDSNADINIISPDNSAALVLLGDNDPDSYATLTLAHHDPQGSKSDSNDWIISHSAITTEKHNLTYAYHSSDMEHDRRPVTTLVMTPDGDVAFYGNVTMPQTYEQLQWNPSGRMSIGHDTITDQWLFVKRDLEDENNVAGILASATQKPTATGDHTIAGLKNEVNAYLQSGDNTGSIKGIHSQAFLKSSGTLNEAYGANIVVGLDAPSPITIDWAYGARIAIVDNAGGTINNYAVLYLDSMPSTIPSDTRFAIYQSGTKDKNYFQGRVGIGTSDTTSRSLTVNGGAKILTISKTGGNDNNFVVSDTQEGETSPIIYNYVAGQVSLGNRSGSKSEPEVTVTGDLKVEEKVKGLWRSIREINSSRNCGGCTKGKICPCNAEAQCQSNEIVIGGGCNFDSCDRLVRKNRPDFAGGKWLCHQESSSDNCLATADTTAYAICLRK